MVAGAVVGSNHSADAGRPFASVDDLWRRAGVPAASLVMIAETEGLRPSMGPNRREGLWTVKALGDEPLPVFAAASVRETAMVCRSTSLKCR